MCFLSSLWNSDMSLISSLKFPQLTFDPSLIISGPSSKCPLRMIPWQPQYSIAGTIAERYLLFRSTSLVEDLLIGCTIRTFEVLQREIKLFNFSMEPLRRYCSTAWWFKSFLTSFQFRYGCVISNFALEHWCAGNGKVSKQDITQPTGMHLRCFFETSHTASQRHLKEGWFANLWDVSQEID